MSRTQVERRFTIQSYETDINERLKPFYTQNHLQEIAYLGSEYCHCSYDTLRQRNLFWALNRIHFKVFDCPKWGDEVILQTWSRAQTGPLWHRNFRMYKASDTDNPILLGTSAWTLVDLVNRSLFRGETGFDPNFHLDEDTLPHCTKIIVPKDLPVKDAGSHIVAYSDIDSNGHANNCMYTQWALDALPFDYVKAHILSDIEVCYYHEIHAGETARFELAEGDGNVFYLSGKVGETLCFVVKMEFV